MTSTVLPAEWVRTTLGDVATLIRNGTFASRPDDDPDGLPILRISAVRAGVVDMENVKYVHGLEARRAGQFAVRSGDLLFTRYNGSRHLVGICGVVPPHSGPVLHPDKLIRVVVSPEVADSHFIAYQMASGLVRDHLEPRIRTTAGQSGISGVDVKSIPVILPPLAEQRRIVDILDDHLSRLDAADQQTRTALQRANAWKRAHADELFWGGGFPTEALGEVLAEVLRSAMSPSCRRPRTSWSGRRSQQVEPPWQSAEQEPARGCVVPRSCPGRSSAWNQQGPWRGISTTDALALCASPPPRRRERLGWCQRDT